VAFWRFAFGYILQYQHMIEVLDVLKMILDVFYLLAILHINLLVSCITEMKKSSDSVSDTSGGLQEVFRIDAVLRIRLRSHAFWTDIASVLDIVMFQIAACAGVNPERFLMLPIVLRMKWVMGIGWIPPGVFDWRAFAAVPFALHCAACLWWIVIEGVGTTAAHMEDTAWRQPDPYFFAVEGVLPCLLGGSHSRSFLGLGELWLGTFMQLLGIYFLGHVLSKATWAMQRLLCADTEKVERFSTLRSVLGHMDCSLGIANRIHKFCIFRFAFAYFPLIFALVYLVHLVMFRQWFNFLIFFF
jgi:hypothetical protein